MSTRCFGGFGYAEMVSSVTRLYIMGLKLHAALGSSEVSSNTSYIPGYAQTWRAARPSGCGGRANSGPRIADSSHGLTEGVDATLDYRTLA